MERKWALLLLVLNLICLRFAFWFEQLLFSGLILILAPSYLSRDWLGKTVLNWDKMSLITIKVKFHHVCLGLLNRLSNFCFLVGIKFLVYLSYYSVRKWSDKGSYIWRWDGVYLKTWNNAFSIWNMGIKIHRNTKKIFFGLQNAPLYHQVIDC